VSNGTIFPDSYIEKFLKFKSVAMEISLESLDNSNDYIRHPSNYKLIKQNIEKYCQYKSDKFSVTIRSVPQFLSLVHYDKLIEFAKSLNLVIDSNQLYDPEFLKANLLPDSIKQTIIKKLSQFIKNDCKLTDVDDVNIRDNTNAERRLSQHAKMIVTLLEEPCTNTTELRKKLVSYCRSQDKNRDVDVGRMIPELKEFFTEYNYYD
jgi:sulfatase maturation enzyme AslB (radical SAM superfamily)